MKRYLILAVILVLPLAFIQLGCETAGDAAPTTVPQSVMQAFQAVFTPVDTWMGEDDGSKPEYTGITFVLEEIDENNQTLTITFTEYDSGSEYICSGTLTITASLSGSTMTWTITGTINLTGGDISELVFDATVSGEWDDVEGNFTGEPAVSGNITADGTSYDAEDFAIEDEDVTYDPVFVVAAMKHTDPDGALIVYSEDGSVWGYPNITVITEVSVDLYGIASDTSGNCVAVGENGAILYSSDGVNWSFVASPTSKDLRGVAWGDSRWVAAADASTIFYSDNGHSWSAAAITTGSTPDALYDIASDGAGNFVAVGQNYKRLYSDDGGENWTGLANVNDQHLYGVAYGGGSRWVAVGVSGKIAYSDDNGVNWTVATDSGLTSLDLNGVSYGNGRFIALGNEIGDIPLDLVIMYSQDGDDWTPVIVPSDFVSIGRPLVDVATNGSGRWSILGGWGDHLLSTDNGDSWTVVALDKYGQYAIAYRP